MCAVLMWTRRRPWSRRYLVPITSLCQERILSTRISDNATLGAALSRAAGHPYLDYVPKRILEPFGMTHTALVYRSEMLTHLAKGYQMGTGGEVDSETPRRGSLDGRGYKIPNGAIYTTVGDLAKFVSFFAGAGSRECVEEIQSGGLSDAVGSPG